MCGVVRHSLSANSVLDCAACEIVRRSAALLPLLQGSLRDLQAQRCLALREIFPSPPRSQPGCERFDRSVLMLKMRRPCSVSHSVYAIRESRIETSAIEKPTTGAPRSYTWSRIAQRQFGYDKSLPIFRLDPPARDDRLRLAPALASPAHPGAGITPATRQTRHPQRRRRLRHLGRPLCGPGPAKAT